MKTYDHKQTMRLAFLGMLGGLLCSVADYFLEYLEYPNTTLGSYGVVDSAWENMELWRFPASIWIASVSVPLYILAFIAIIRQMSSTHEKTARIFGGSLFLGVLGGLFIHIMLCVMPVVYKYLIANSTQEIATGAVDAMTDSFIGPFFIYYVFLVIIPLITWCVYCCQKGSCYRPLTAILITGFSILCIAIGSMFPSLQILSVGSTSRMFALWGLNAWLVERKMADSSQQG